MPPWLNYRFALLFGSYDQHQRVDERRLAWGPPRGNQLFRRSTRRARAALTDHHALTRDSVGPRRRVRARVRRRAVGGGAGLSQPRRLRRDRARPRRLSLAGTRGLAAPAARVS